MPDHNAVQIHCKRPPWDVNFFGQDQGYVVSFTALFGITGALWYTCTTQRAHALA